MDSLHNERGVEARVRPAASHQQLAKEDEDGARRKRVLCAAAIHEVLDEGTAVPARARESQGMGDLVDGNTSLARQVKRVVNQIGCVEVGVTGNRTTKAVWRGQ